MAEMRVRGPGLVGSSKIVRKRSFTNKTEGHPSLASGVISLLRLELSSEILIAFNQNDDLNSDLKMSYEKTPKQVTKPESKPIAEKNPPLASGTKAASIPSPARHHLKH